MVGKSESRTVVLGAEYDAGVREALMAVLRQMGAEVEHHERGMGGSQEVETLEVQLRGRSLVVEAETYVGLSVTGDDEIVTEVAELVKARMTST
jgi:hypothetical protein